jgi:4-amino-4-deoxy-L-arabinose transferase-like glycosyltransferase
VGSLALMFYAGRHNPWIIVQILFALWVPSPFIALALADRLAARWSLPIQTTLDWLGIVLAVVSLPIYVYDVLRPPKSTGAFLFVAVPLGSLVLLLIVVPIAALLSHRGKRGY